MQLYNIKIIQGNPRLLDESNENEDFCFYMFEWPTSMVCPANAKGPGAKSANVMKLLMLELV